MSAGRIVPRRGPGSPYNQRRYREMKLVFLRQVIPVCHLCNGVVDVSLSGNHPQGPTVDHVIPTSRGGSFWDRSNWKLAHRQCNTVKGRKVPVAAVVLNGRSRRCDCDYLLDQRCDICEPRSPNA